MTKAALSEKYWEWNRNIGKLSEQKNSKLHELQELNAAQGGTKWCSIDELVKELARTEDRMIWYQTMKLAREYYTIEGQEEALRNLALATDNFKI